MQRMTREAPRDGRLDVLISEAFACSRSQAARLIEEGTVALDGQAVGKASLPVKAGALLQVDWPEARETAVEKEDIPLRILYQDEDIAVVDKPRGMVVHPAAGNETGTVVNALLFALDGLSGIGGVKRPGIVHRLDKDTSGVLLVAKNDAAHVALSAQLKAREMEKHYLAVVEGEMKREEGRIDLPIGRSRRDRKRMAVDPEGREALTEWKLLENLRDAALLDVHILTGRTHQIRVHMQSQHHPVAGDTIYGLKHGVRAPRLMLHAYSLCFVHPRTKEAVRFVAQPDEEFQRALGRLRKRPEAPLPFGWEGEINP